MHLFQADACHRGLLGNDSLFMGFLRFWLRCDRTGNRSTDDPQRALQTSPHPIRRSKIDMPRIEGSPQIALCVSRQSV